VIMTKVSNLLYLFEQMIPLTVWQKEAPLIWYHGSPFSGLTVLAPQMAKAHMPYIAMYGVYLSDSKEAARIFGVNVYEVDLTNEDKQKLYPDPDIQVAEKGTYTAAVYQGILRNVKQIVKSTKYTPPLIVPPGGCPPCPPCS
jgi:hypothetical protein